MPEAIKILCWCTVTALVVGSLAYYAGRLVKDWEWKEALGIVERHGLIVLRKRDGGSHGSVQ